MCNLMVALKVAPVRPTGLRPGCGLSQNPLWHNGATKRNRNATSQLTAQRNRGRDEVSPGLQVVAAFDEGGAVRLVIPGRPVPASRPRVTRGHAYYPKRYSDWLAAAAWQTRTTGVRFAGAVKVAVIVKRDSVEVEVTPSTVARPSGVIADLDNVGAKNVLDALQRGGMLTNDSQVTELVVRFGEEET